MTRYILCLVLLVGSAAGCANAPSKSDVALDINGVQFSAADFEQSFKNSVYGRQNTPQSREKFLDVLIVRTLILKQAENQGLDRDPKFLADVERFWQQALINLAVERQSRQLAVDAKVSEQEIQDFYAARKDTDFSGKEFGAVYEQIKTLLLRDKQVRAVAAWSDSLINNARASVNKKMLGIIK